MAEREHIPTLSRSVREAYRAGSASPWLKARVVAEINASTHAMPAWKKYAGALLVICTVLVAGDLLNIRNAGKELSVTTREMTAFSPPSYHLEGLPGAAIEVPGIAALERLPDLNHVHVPGLSRYRTGGFCIYSQRGEKSC